jgi:transposase-like protein
LIATTFSLQWVRQAEVDDGQRPGVTSEEHRRVIELERENRELRRANEILKAAASFMWTLRLCGSCRGRRPWQIRNKG